jgi:type II secretory pathway predicted ATPase ExeA
MPRQRNRLPATPFRSACDGSCFYASATHQEALARLQFLVRQGRSLGILTGGDGSGKSLVLDRFLGELRQTGQPACLLNLMGLEPRDFLWELAAGLRAQPRTGDDVFTLWRHVVDRIRANHLLHARTTILLDDADEAAHEVLIFVLRLLKSQPAGTTLALVADPDRMTRLGGDLLQLSELRIHLEPWELSDLREYLQTSLTRAGGDPRTFDEAAVARLHALSDGLPRWAAHLAELAWLAAAGEQLNRITADTVESAYEALSASYQAAPAGYAA